VADARLKALVQSVRQLPTLPTIYSRVTEMVQDPRSSVSDVSRVVGQDQVVVSKLLRLVNSSFYGLRQSVSTVQRAMTIIGFRSLKEMLLALTVLPLLDKCSEGTSVDLAQFWAHSVGCAAAGRVLSKTLRVSEPEEMFTAGLLHDVGKIAQLRFMEEEFVQLLERAGEENVPLYVLEPEVLGFDHSAVGRILAEKWRFPEKLAEIVACHHVPATAARFPREVAMIHLADIICRACLMGEVPDARVPPLDRKAWTTLGLKKEQLAPIMRETAEEFEKGMAFLFAVKDQGAGSRQPGAVHAAAG